MDLLQETGKEVSLKHTGIKQGPYSAPVQDTHANQMQYDILQLQTDMQILKESMITTQHQYAAPCPPSKMKDEIQDESGNQALKANETS